MNEQLERMVVQTSEQLRIKTPLLIFSPPMERKREKLKKYTVSHYEPVEGKDGGDLEQDLGGRVEKRRG